MATTQEWPKWNTPERCINCGLSVTEGDGGPVWFVMDRAAVGPFCGDCSRTVTKSKKVVQEVGGVIQ